MEQLHKIEKSLEGPIAALPSLPKESKRGLAMVWPWLALAAGAMQLITAMWLYQWASVVNNYLDWATSASQLDDVSFVTTKFSLWAWLAIAVLIVDAIILLIAFPKLQKKQKTGWDLLLLAGLINLLYGFVSVLIDGRGVFSGLLGAVVGSVIGLYLLYQVREFYGGKPVSISNARTKSKTNKSTNKPKN